ncbi:MAG: hypothetical protein ACYS99_21780 [Planctomycetota bacterium]|jgi:hypothetical protein
MRPIRVALLVLLVLAAGVLGYVIGASDVPELRTLEDAPPSGQRALLPAPPDLAEAARRLDLSDLSVPELPVGNGRITGRVLTESGEPVAGAVVRAYLSWRWPGPHRRGGPPPEELDLEAAVRLYVQMWFWRQAGLREAVTLADGSYVLEGIADAPYHVPAWADGHLIRPVDLTLTGLPTAGSVVDFVAKRVVSIPIRVITEDGSHLRSARIECSIGRDSETRWWRSEAPEILLPPGTWLLRATEESRTGFRSEKVEVTLALGATPDPVILETSPTGCIYGNVKGLGGLARDVRTWAQVKVLRIPPDVTPDPARLRHEGTDQSSFPLTRGFEFADLEPGRYLVGVVFGMHEVLVSEVVEVRGHPVEVVLVVPPPREDSSVVVRVEDEMDKPCSDVTFYAGRLGGEDYPHQACRAVRLKDGSFRVGKPPPRLGREIGVRAFLEARSARYGSSWVVVDFGSAEAITVRFTEPAELEILFPGGFWCETVSDIEIALIPVIDGRPIGDWRGFPGPWRQDARSAGRRRVGPVAPGVYVVKIWTGSIFAPPAARMRVDLKPGLNQRLAPLPCDLTVKTSGVPDGGRIMLKWTGPDDDPKARLSRVALVKQGNAEFSRIPAGDYLLTYKGDATKGRMSVRLTVSTTVRFVAAPIGK